MDTTNKYIKISDVQTSQDGIISRIDKLWPMKILENWIKSIFNCEMKSFTTEIQNQINDDKKECNSVKNNIETILDKISNLEIQHKSMLKEISDLKTQQATLEKTTSVLQREYNTQKARVDAGYRNAISAFCTINRKFKQEFPWFGKNAMLDVLEMLVHYLVKPTVEFKETILQKSNNHQKVSSIIEAIEQFNRTHRDNLEAYLKRDGSSICNQIIFPESRKYDKNVMQVFNDENIEEGSPIYIISLGYSFPNSNTNAEKPLVYPRK